MGLVKLINNCLSPLPFYDSEEDQYKYKDYAFGHHCPVITYKNTLLPFQVILNKPVTGLNYVHLHYGYTDKYTIITERMQENGLRFDSYDDFVIMTYPGILPIVDIVYEGQYYLTISIAGLGRIVSEIFTATAHIEPYLLLSYRNSYNFYLKGGMVDFSNNFRFLCYVRSQLGRPDYEFEEESTDRMGYSFIESQVSKKVYNFNAVMPEYLCDALRIVRMCDDKKVYSKGKLYELTNFEMDVDWQDQGDLAAVNCNFETDTVIANIGGYEPEAAGGDFNEDFNEDYDDQQSGGEGTSVEGESQTITVYQEAMDEVYTPTMSGASTYAMLVESIVNFDPAYIDIYGSLLDDEGNVVQEDVKLFRLGEDSSSSRISTGDTFQGKYESGIEVGYYKLTYCIFRQVGQTGTVKYTFDGGTGRTECPYTMPSSGIPGTTYNTDNIEVRNYNANITLFNISVRMSS